MMSAIFLLMAVLHFIVVGQSLAIGRKGNAIWHAVYGLLLILLSFWVSL